MSKIRPFYPILLVLALGLLYALLSYFAFTDWLWAGPLGSMTASFLMVLPFAVGVLTMYFAPKERLHSMGYAFFMPWLPAIAFAVTLCVFSLELIICVVMALPILLIMSSVGGLIMRSIMLRKKGTTLMLLLALSFPYFAAPVEAQFEHARRLTQTDTQIVIDASVEAVWANIKTVPAITETEHSFNWLHVVGLPRPVAADLSHEGIGGVRDATFEGGLRFDETITEWEHHDTIRFTIEATSQSLLPPPLNLIGSEEFDVIEGVYHIEPLEDGSVLLHLSSTHYLSTGFNEYGSFWTDLIMRDLQNYILEVIKLRAETTP